LLGYCYVKNETKEQIMHTARRENKDGNWKVIGEDNVFYATFDPRPLN
jgi:hypothetical protein